MSNKPAILAVISLLAVGLIFGSSSTIYDGSLEEVVPQPNQGDG